MTTDELYQQYQGTSIPSFDGDSANNGQCEQWYLMVRTKRDGLPVVYGNAIDRWLQQEPDHYDYIPIAPGVYPKKDDYVVWGAGVGSSAGHIDVCAQDGNASGFLGYDSNWGDVPILKTIQHNYGFGILGYVRRKGSNMSDLVNGDIDNLLKDFGLTPTQADYNATKLSNKDLFYYLETRFKHAIVNGDVDNLLKDVGITPTQADYNAISTGYKNFVYYLQARLKPLIGANYTKIGNITPVGDIFKKG